MHMVRPQRGGAIFHHGQGHHLSAQLGKPLHAAANAQETVLVDRDDIAGVVPPIRGGLQHQRRRRTDIALHDIGALDVQLAAIINALHRHQLGLAARHQLADRARAVVLRLVDRQHRRGLGQAIALHNLQIEPAAQGRTGLVLYPFSAANRKAQGGEVALIGGAHSDSRYARGMGGNLTPEVAGKTSNVPFLAMLTGAQGDGAFSALATEAKGLNAACAAGLAAIWVLRRLP